MSDASATQRLERVWDEIAEWEEAFDTWIENGDERAWSPYLYVMRSGVVSGSLARFIVYQCAEERCATDARFVTSGSNASLFVTFVGGDTAEWRMFGFNGQPGKARAQDALHALGRAQLWGISLEKRLEFMTMFCALTESQLLSVVELLSMLRGILSRTSEGWEYYQKLLDHVDDSFLSTIGGLLPTGELRAEILTVLGKELLRRSPDLRRKRKSSYFTGLVLDSAALLCSTLVDELSVGVARTALEAGGSLDEAVALVEAMTSK